MSSSARTRPAALAAEREPAVGADLLDHAASAASGSTVSGCSPHRPSTTALYAAVAVAGRAERAEQLAPRPAPTAGQPPGLPQPRRKVRAARIGPTVCELDGPIPTLNRSNTEMAIRAPRSLCAHAMPARPRPAEGCAVSVANRARAPAAPGTTRTRRRTARHRPRPPVAHPGTEERAEEPAPDEPGQRRAVGAGDGAGFRVGRGQGGQRGVHGLHRVRRHDRGGERRPADVAERRDLHARRERDHRRDRDRKRACRRGSRRRAGRRPAARAWPAAAPGRVGGPPARATMPTRPRPRPGKRGRRPAGRSSLRRR